MFYWHDTKGTWRSSKVRNTVQTRPTTLLCLKTHPHADGIQLNKAILNVGGYGDYTTKSFWGCYDLVFGRCFNLKKRPFNLKKRPYEEPLKYQCRSLWHHPGNKVGDANLNLDDLKSLSCKQDCINILFLLTHTNLDNHRFFKSQGAGV